MLSVHYLHTATLLGNGQVLIAGGPYNTAEIYNPENATFISTDGMLRARAGHAAAMLPSGNVLITGGIGGEPSAEIYDVTTDGFHLAADMTTSRAVHTATLLLNGQVLVAGGFGLDSGSAELYTD
jgi:hypothetical protein